MESKATTFEKRLLTVSETCEYLSLGQTKVRELIRGRNGFALKIGGRWYVDKQRLDKWLAQRTA